MRQVDEEQAERLVNTYSDLILRLSYTYLHSAQDAEDICQTVFLKCLTSGQVFESRDHEKAWIIRTAVKCVQGPAAQRPPAADRGAGAGGGAPRPGGTGVLRAGGGHGPAGEIPAGDLSVLL